MKPSFAIGFITSLIFVMLGGCGFMKNTSGKQTSVIPDKIVINTLPVIVNLKDTVRITKKDSIKNEVLRPVQHLMDVHESFSVPYDTLMKRNFEWQKFVLRLIDSNVKRRVQRDETLEILRSVRDTVNATKAITKVAKEDHKFKSSTQNVFDLVIFICLGICTLSAIISITKSVISAVRHSV